MKAYNVRNVRCFSRVGCYTNIVPDVQVLSEVVANDPFLFYALLATSVLAAASLLSGWLRGDVLAIVRPQGLFRISVAVVAAFVLVWLGHSAGGADTVVGNLLVGLSRFPLYVIALAYGPSAGLLAAGLYAAFATTGLLPGWSEAVLALELTALGWFALEPSPRRHRWAGPLNAAVAYVLAWATGGSALLQASSGDGMSLAAHLAYHLPGLPGVVLSMALLALVSPHLYERFFPTSRVKPKSKAKTEARAQSADSAALPEFASSNPSPKASNVSQSIKDISDRPVDRRRAERRKGDRREGDRRRTYLTPNPQLQDTARGTEGDAKSL